MLNIILFGAPGCGKGTQAKRLAEHYDLYHISTGEVIRSEILRPLHQPIALNPHIQAR